MDDELIAQQYQGLKALQSGEAITANHSSQFKSELGIVLGNDISFCAVVANSTVTLVFLVSRLCGSLSSLAALRQLKHLVEKM